MNESKLKANSTYYIEQNKLSKIFYSMLQLCFLETELNPMNIIFVNND